MGEPVKFTAKKGTEVSGAYPGGESWTVKFDANGSLSAKDDQIEAALIAAAAHPDSGIKVKDA